jgi:DNA-binding CsgD family transcriptional regulator
LTEIDRSHIEFARPFVLALAAAAQVGLRDLNAAEATLTEAEKSARSGSDDYLRAFVEMMRFRMMLYRGKARAALLSVSGIWSQHVLPSLKAEFLATQAAALACVGEPERALELCRRAEELSSWLEPRLLSRWARVLAAFAAEAPEAGEQARNACRATFVDGGADVLVFAQRVYPPLLGSLVRDESLRTDLAVTLQRANDHQQARAYKLIQDPRPVVTDVLTPRELEVYEMLAKGRSNREIAGKLYISELTAKVHVRNILRKLSLRTRTEVAIHALTTPRHADDGADLPPDHIPGDRLA